MWTKCQNWKCYNIMLYQPTHVCVSQLTSKYIKSSSLFCLEATSKDWLHYILSFMLDWKNISWFSPERKHIFSHLLLPFDMQKLELLSRFKKLHIVGTWVSTQRQSASFVPHSQGNSMMIVSRWFYMVRLQHVSDLDVQTMLSLEAGQQPRNCSRYLSTFTQWWNM